MELLKKIIYVIPTILLTGCYEEYKLDVNPDPVLCVNSLIQPDMTADVKVSRTWLYTDEEAWQNHGVDDATVSITVNGDPVGSDYLMKEGDRVKISADSKRYGRAEGETTLPVAVRFSDVKFTPELKYLLVSAYTGSLYADITLDILIEATIEDPGEERNYYQTELVTKTPTGGIPPWEEPDVTHPQSWMTTGQLDYNAEPIFSEHISLIETVTGEELSNETFFTDKRFDGGKYTLRLRYKDASIHINEKNENAEKLDFKYILKLGTLSESYYNRINYDWQTENGIAVDMADWGFGDAIWGYSNVTTGAGVIAAKSESECVIELRDYLIDWIRAAGGNI
ncbi:MAG: DUF4249 domain-containing protein [Muribaculaceae bacterium]|nr:DUF4249 domain-containing protein [Muribaculaceae bacterium]